MIQGCKYGKIFNKRNNFLASKRQLKQKLCKLKRDASPKHFALRNDKGDLKGFQTNFETFFFYNYICHNMTPVDKKARKNKKNACTLLKKRN